MTSASDRTDDDIIVITADDLADQSRGVHAAPGRAERETGDPELGDPELGDPELGDPELGDPELGDPELGDPEPGAQDRADGPEADDEPAADPTLGTGSGAFAMPGASTVGQPGTNPAAGVDTPALDADQPGSSQLGSDQPSSDPVAASSGPITQPDVTLGTASTGSTSAATAVRPDENWPEIQAMFVDDPRSAVERAAEVTGGALSALVTAAKDREQSLRQNWQADGTGTEELRTSLQHYRELANRLSRLGAEL
jgi:hypothetical protein